MGLCNTIIDNPPDPFFMVDCYRYHDKYLITKNEEWFGFAEVDVQEISNTMAQSAGSTTSSTPLSLLLLGI